MTLREECAEKVDSETRAHRATVANLHKHELEIKALETKLASATDKVQSCKSEISMLKSDITSKKEATQELEFTIKNLRNDLSETINSYREKLSKLGSKSSK